MLVTGVGATSQCRPGVPPRRSGCFGQNLRDADTVRGDHLVGLEWVGLGFEISRTGKLAEARGGKTQLDAKHTANLEEVRAS